MAHCCGDALEIGRFSLQILNHSLIDLAIRKDLGGQLWVTVDGMELMMILNSTLASFEERHRLMRTLVQQQKCEVLR